MYTAIYSPLKAMRLKFTKERCITFFTVSSLTLAESFRYMRLKASKNLGPSVRCRYCAFTNAKYLSIPVAWCKFGNSQFWESIECPQISKVAQQSSHSARWRGQAKKTTSFT